MIDRVIRSVLIVDDDPEFRELAGRLLAASGMTVVGEAGARAFVNKADLLNLPVVQLLGDE
jgi:CheY-like chemotaxis protein